MTTPRQVPIEDRPVPIRLPSAEWGKILLALIVHGAAVIGYAVNVAAATRTNTRDIAAQSQRIDGIQDSLTAIRADAAYIRGRMEGAASVAPSGDPNP